MYRLYRRNFLLSLLLALSLVCAQIGAMAHAVSHFKAVPTHQHDQSPPDDKGCDLCLAYAAAGNGMASSEFAFFLPDFTAVLVASADYFFFSHTRRFFSPRAPPRTL